MELQQEVARLEAALAERGVVRLAIGVPRRLLQGRSRRVSILAPRLDDLFDLAYAYDVGTCYRITMLPCHDPDLCAVCLDIYSNK